MALGLEASKQILVNDLQNAINNAFEAAFKTMFIYSAGEEGNYLATKFAKTAAEQASGPIAEAIYKFITNGKIVGQNPTVSTIIAPPMSGGPCTGVLPFIGNELSII